MASTAQIQQKIDEIAGPLRRVFQGPGGAEALALLEQLFVFTTLVDEDVYQTHVNIGAHAVVARIRRIVAGSNSPSERK